MNINIFVNDLFKKIKNIFNQKHEIQGVKDINENESLEINNSKLVLKKMQNTEQDIKVKYIISDNKINVRFSRLEEYIEFIKEKLEKHICLTNIDIEIWNKFNRYNISKFTKNKIEEYENIFYLVMEQAQYYFEENNLSILNRWFMKKESQRYRIGNDISFLLRYSENLLRYKNGNKRLLSYEKFENIDLLKTYLDSKFTEFINARKNEISLNIPNVLLDLDIDDFDISNYKLDNNKKIEEKIEEKINIKNMNKELLELNQDDIVNSDELDKLIDDIDDFEI